MKIFLLVLLVASCIAETSIGHAVALALLNTTMEACQLLSGVSNATRLKLHNKIFDDVPFAKEFLYCIFRTVNWIDENGNFNKEVTKSFVGDRPERLASLEKCIVVVGSDPMDTAFQAYKCYAQSLPENVNIYTEDKKTEDVRNEQYQKNTDRKEEQRSEAHNIQGY